MPGSHHPSASPSSSFGGDDNRPFGDATIMENMIVREGIQWRRGAFLEARDDWGKWCAAKIVDIVPSTQKVLIHFYKWNQRFDTWYPMSSGSLRPSAARNLSLSQSSNGSAPGTPAASSAEFKEAPTRDKTMTEIKQQKGKSGAAVSLEHSPGITPESPMTRNKSQGATKAGLKPTYTPGDYVLSKWKNKFDYVAFVRDYRIQEKNRRHSSHPIFEYQVQYVCDGVLEWMHESKLTACTEAVAMQLLNTVPESQLGVSTTPKSEEVIYDEAMKRFTDSCKDRRRRQRESLESNPTTMTPESPLTIISEGDTIAKRRRTESLTSEATMSPFLAVSPKHPPPSVNKTPAVQKEVNIAGPKDFSPSKSLALKAPVIKEISPIKAAVKSMPSPALSPIKESPACVTNSPPKTLTSLQKDQEHISLLVVDEKPSFRIPNEDVKPPITTYAPASRAFSRGFTNHAVCRTATTASRTKQKWRGIPSTTTIVRKSARSPQKKYPFMPTVVSRGGPQLVNTPKRSLGTVPPLRGSSDTNAPKAKPCQSPPKVLPHNPLLIPMSVPSSISPTTSTGATVTTAVINIVPLPPVTPGATPSPALTAAVVQYPCQFCKEKNEERTFRKSSLLQAHINIYHSGNKSATPVSSGIPRSANARHASSSGLSGGRKSSRVSTPLCPASEGDSLDSLERGERNSIVYCSRCGSKHETDVMIQCDVCSTWSHMACYDLGGEDQDELARPPEYWECDSCSGSLRPVRPSRKVSWRYDWMESGNPPWPSARIPQQQHSQGRIASRKRRASSVDQTATAAGGAAGTGTSEEAGVVRLAASSVGLAKCLESVARRLRLELVDLRPPAPPPFPAHVAGQLQPENTDFDLLQLSLNDDDIPRLLGDVVAAAEDPLASLDVTTSHHHVTGSGGVGVGGSDQFTDDVISGLIQPSGAGGRGIVGGGNQDSSCGSLQAPGDISGSNLTLLDNIQLGDLEANLPDELPAVSVADITLATGIIAAPHAHQTSLPPPPPPLPAAMVVDTDLLDYQQQLEGMRARLADWVTQLEAVEETVAAAEKNLDWVESRHHRGSQRRRKGAGEQIDGRFVRLELNTILMKLRAQAYNTATAGGHVNPVLTTVVRSGSSVH